MCRRSLAPTPARSPAYWQLCWLLISLSACARPLLPTLSVHAILVLHHAASDQAARGHQLSVLAQASFRARRQATPRQALGTRRQPLPMLPNCDQSVLCEWETLAEEAALAELGVSP